MLFNILETTLPGVQENTLCYLSVSISEDEEHITPKGYSKNAIKERRICD